MASALRKKILILQKSIGFFEPQYLIFYHKEIIPCSKIFHWHSESAISNFLRRNLNLITYDTVHLKLSIGKGRIGDLHDHILDSRIRINLNLIANIKRLIVEISFCTHHATSTTLWPGGQGEEAGKRRYDEFIVHCYIQSTQKKYQSSRITSKFLHEFFVKSGF